jgi:hypothetical protein
MKSYEIRPPEKADWPAIFAAAMRAVPDSEHENREWWHNRQAIDENIQRRYHLVAEDEAGNVRGYGAIEEGPDPGLFRMFVVAGPGDISSGLGDFIYHHLLEKLDELEARIVWVREESRDPIVDFFRKKGFLERTRFLLENGRQAIVVFLELNQDAAT